MYSLCYSMWADDERWYPTMLADKRFEAYYLFEGHDKILEERLEVLKDAENTSRLQYDK